MGPEATWLTQTFPSLLASLQADTPAYWGQMSAQHMLEHLGGIFLLATKPDHQVPVFISEDKMPRAQGWLESDLPFRKDIRPPVMPETPPPLRFPDIDHAKAQLLKAVARFQQFYTEHPEATVPHPAFGPLNHHQWLRFHVKHCQHHLRQFGLLPQESTL